MGKGKEVRKKENTLALLPSVSFLCILEKVDGNGKSKKKNNNKKNR